MKLSERKRQDILSAAIAEFQDQGFVAARISRIGERAKVSSRTLYRHFDSKEALFDAIVEIVFSECAARTRKDLEPSQPLRDQLIAAVNAHIDSITSEHFIGLSRIVMAEFIRNSELAKRAFKQIAILDNAVQHLIAQAMEEGLLREQDPDYAAQQLIAMLKSFYYFPMLILRESQTFSKSREEVVSDCVTMFLAHYERLK